MKTIYPTDTVDSLGKVYPTVGENIRNGAKNLNMDSLLELFYSIYNKKCTYDIVSFTGKPNEPIAVDSDIYFGGVSSISLKKGIIIDFFIINFNSTEYTQLIQGFYKDKYEIHVRVANSEVSGKIMIIRTED